MSNTGADSRYDAVVQANVALHTRMAEEYSTCEPHFRPENVERVERKLQALFDRAGRGRLLDLGCGTGFIISIAKKSVARITGVDVTQAMLDKVDRSGDAEIELVNHDTGSFAVEEGGYDVVTAYSFLHHLYDIRPTLATAYRALRPGGCFYADLEPNFYFWQAIGELDRSQRLDPIVLREIEMVTFKDEDIQRNFGVDKEVFNQAEFGKNVGGGFREEVLRRELESAGFREVETSYNWFLGQGFLINDPTFAREERLRQAAKMEELLIRALPVSRCIFKYLGFVAVK